MVSFLYFKPITLAAGIFGILQGIAWFTLSLMAILMYANVMTLPAPNFASYTPEAFLKYTIGSIFADRPYGDDVLSGADMLIWSIFYLTFSVLWICSSIFLLAASIGKKQKQYRTSSVIWSCITLVICVLDLSLVVSLIVWMADYNVDMRGLEFEQAFYNNLIWTALGVTMAVAGRGFILWVINLTLLILLFKVEKRPTIMLSTFQSQPHMPTNNFFNSQSGPYINAQSNYQHEIPNQFHNQQMNSQWNQNHNWDPNMPRIPTPDYPQNALNPNAPKSALKKPAPLPPIRHN